MTRFRALPRPRAVRLLRRRVALSAAILALAGATGAAAQSAVSPNDQPTPGTLPSEVSLARPDAAATRPTGDVAPPRALIETTPVVRGDRRSTSSAVNPLDHLPAKDRAATGGTRRD